MMFRFRSQQNTAHTDASACAPAGCATMASASSDACDTGILCIDTAIWAVSFFMLMALIIAASIGMIVRLCGIFMILVLVWSLVNIFLVPGGQRAESNGISESPAAV